MSSGPKLAEETRNAHRFSLYNAVNFQITLGAPMVLYAKALGGTATTIGIVASLAPLLTVLQLPTAYFIPKIGYKGFVLLGWLSRSVIMFSLAILPLVSPFGPETKISLLLMALFVFNVLRGISTGAWLPWLTSLVPEELRGQFLRRDQTYMQAGGMLALATSTVILWNKAQPWQYALLFFVSALAATASLLYIKRVPDVEIGPQLKGTGQPVPWAEMLKFEPFRRLLVFNVVYNWVIGGLAAFVIGFLQVRAGFRDGAILACSLLSFIGATCCVPLAGPLLERVGCKPILRLALVCYLWAILCWFFVSAKLLSADRLEVSLVYFITGVAGGLFSIANTRIAMDTMPLMGRNHFFSLFTVFASVSLGLAPVVWGIFLDLLTKTEFQLFWFNVNRYSLYFFFLVLLTSITFYLTRPLVEKPAEPVSLALRDAIIAARLRLLNRFLNR